MKQNFSFIYKVALVVGDGLALTLGFTLAYILRVSLDPRPLPEPVPALTYITLIAVLLPIWLAMFSILGLYSKRIYSRRPKEASRLLIGSMFGVLLLVSFDFFSQEAVFPAKLVPIYAALASFILLWLARTILRAVRLHLHSKNFGVVRVLLVGNTEPTYYLGKYLFDNKQSGYKVVAVVANKQYVYEKLLGKKFNSVSSAIELAKPHAIIHTDTSDLTKVYDLSIENHLDYQFVPSHEALFTAKHSTDLLGAFPMINVYTTPLIGWGRVVKRAMDIVIGLLAIILTSPIWLLVTFISKLSDPQGKVFYKQKRLTRFKKDVYIYKFRSHKSEYSGVGMTPEEAFTKMGRPELIEKFRENGNQLEHDPRETKLGRFLRRTSIDELPQLFNVLKGDISLVGPRALVPGDLENYEFKSLILSVKSGLTGLAQISGRNDISFEERRKLDMYYVQNWTVWMDVQIIIRTIFMVITGKGAR